MTRAVKAVSTYRGRDPRDFVLCGFGGNGPVVAAAIARALQMRRVLVPLAPGVFSAAGLLLSEIEHEFVRTLTARGRDASERVLQAAYRELEDEAERALVAEGVSREAVVTSRFADIRYAGQAYELTMPVAAGAPDLGRITADFNAEHHRTYGHASAGRADRHRQRQADRAGGRERRRLVRPARRPRAERGRADGAAPTSGPSTGRSTCRSSRARRSSTRHRARGR